MARTALLNTDTEDLKELLSNGKNYSVPPYQRDYSWKQEHWEDLWEDLMNAEANREDHYMGPVVLESGERKFFRIIDGQQRMASLSILILAYVDYLYVLARENVDDAANGERAALLESSYLGAKDPATLIRRSTVTTLAAVRQSPLPIYIPDDEFEGDFSVLRLRNRSTSGKRLRYLLAKIEKQLSGTDISDEAMTATVEHILPENPGEVGWEHFTAEAHERSYERIGNYSLLDRALNGQVAGNASFAQKQLVYAQSQYQTSKELLDYADWTEKTIALRQAGMAKVAKASWALNI